MAGTLAEALVGHIDSVFVGPNGDYPAVLETLLGVSAEDALWKPEPTQNSIWQIVEHLTASKEWQLEMLQDKNPPSPAWVEPSGGEPEWQAALKRLSDSHLRLQTALRAITDADLLKVPDIENGRTLLELILSSGPAHEAHHCGQIDYVKGLLKSEV